MPREALKGRFGITTFIIAKRFFVIALIGVGVYFSQVTGSKAASDICPGTVSARVLEPITNDTSYKLEIFDDGDISRHFQERFTEEMKVSGQPLNDSAPYIIEFNPGLSDGRKLAIQMLIREQKSGQIVWTGNLYCSMQSDDRVKVVEFIVRPLISALGRDLTNQKF